jgi:hypothetical protein
MGETEWYRIVGRKRMSREEVLPARSGRFHEDPRLEPTSYLGNSLLTVWKESQAARAGSARLNPDAFSGWRVVVKDVGFVDLREAEERKRLSLTDAELLGDPAPPRCKEVARGLRSSKEGVYGILYRSVRHSPDGLCLALFLEKGDAILRFEPVAQKEWTAFVESLGHGKE